MKILDIFKRKPKRLIYRKRASYVQNPLFSEAFAHIPYKSQPKKSPVRTCVEKGELTLGVTIKGYDTFIAQLEEIEQRLTRISEVTENISIVINNYGIRQNEGTDEHRTIPHLSTNP